MKSKVLLVDSEENVVKQLRCSLETEYEVFTALDEREAMASFQREKPQVVILDLSSDFQTSADQGGLRLLEQILEREPSTRVIIMTDTNDDANALQAVRLGAFDYYSKPIVLEEMKVVIKRAMHMHSLHQRLLATSPSGYGFRSVGKNAINLKSAKKAMETEYIRKALVQNRGVISRAARDLGISRVNLYGLMAKYAIHIKEFKATNPRSERQDSRHQQTVQAEPKP